MTAYRARLDGGKREARVEVIPRGPGRFEVRVDGAVHLLDVAPLEAATASVLVEGASFPVGIDLRGARTVVKVRGEGVTLELQDERAVKMGGA